MAVDGSVNCWDAQMRPVMCFAKAASRLTWRTVCNWKFCLDVLSESGHMVGGLWSSSLHGDGDVLVRFC